VIRKENSELRHESATAEKQISIPIRHSKELNEEGPSDNDVYSNYNQRAGDTNSNAYSNDHKGNGDSQYRDEIVPLQTFKQKDEIMPRPTPDVSSKDP